MKSFLSKPISGSEEFKPFSIVKAEKGLDDTTDFSSKQDTSKVFRADESFWKALYEDASFRKQLDAMIEKRVLERMELEVQPFRDRGVKEGYQAGFQSGMETGQAILKEQMARVESICAGLLEEKSKILSSHTKGWLRAFSHLLKRFLVPDAKIKAEALTEWVQESLKDFESKSKIKIRIGNKSFETINAEALGVTHASIVYDPSLNADQILVDVDGGGLIFSAQEEFAKLEEKLKAIT